jgi:hypothetical protein
MVRPLGRHDERLEVAVVGVAAEAVSAQGMACAVARTKAHLVEHAACAAKEEDAHGGRGMKLTRPPPAEVVRR